MNSAIASFWDKKAKGYAAKPVSDVNSYKETLIEVAKHLKSSDKVLEIGCGTGSTAVQMAEYVSKWVGTDISPEMIRIAKSKPAPESAEFLAADADTQFEDAPFDVVTAFHIIHLVPSPADTISSIFGQLKPGGLFISKTVCPGEMGIMPKLAIPLMRLFGQAPPDLHLLTIDQIENDIRQAGFVVEEIRTFGKSTASPYIVARKPE